MSKLIVSEKHNVAKRIAQILSGGKAKQEKTGKVPIYVFSTNGEEVRCLGLKGHILRVDFPRKYNNWQEIDPAKLIDAPLVKLATQKFLLKVLQTEAKKVTEAVISCDFDREGEVIGVDCANILKKVNPQIKIKRARFSALTEPEIKKAFANLGELYLELAQAGEARQDIDLIWGATLTRFLSLASFRLGRQFLSVGRVQSPTLVLIAEKEKERQAFVVKPYWQLKGFFRKDEEKFQAYHGAIRFWGKEEAQKILGKLKKLGKVKKVEREEKVLSPPAPFNTTAFLTAAASLKISPPEAMRIAENLYNQGFISYPRVDNTVYPSSLDLKEILEMLLETELGTLAKEILSQEKIVPTRGKTQATDHPPIYPTGPVQKEKLRPRQWKIYDLVSRRFLATLAEEARQQSLKVVIEISGESFILKGLTTLKEGWLRVYPFGRKKDEEIPLLKEKEEVELLKAVLEEKETQPPPRYSQGRLIKEMERLGLGTKATRHLILKNLYDRSYAHSDPIVPTELGLKVAEALRENASPIASHEMTAKLEKEMDSIAEGKLRREKVVDNSRVMLAQVMLDLKAKSKEVGEIIKEGIKSDKTVGTCPNCGSTLRIIKAKKSGKRFVGCGNFPNCSLSYPLPQFGEVITLREVCEQCLAPKVKVITGKRRPWVLCLDPKCPSKTQSKVKSQKDK